MVKAGMVGEVAKREQGCGVTGNFWTGKSARAGDKPRAE